MSKKYAVINKVSNVVENVVMWDGVSNWSPGDDFYLIDVTGVNPVGFGMKYESETFIFINGEDIPGE